ncbi:MAG: Flp pilus assembly complex ATPase component TadA, partial [Proteobacteria bacterium]|nr:Flp pilus assembly complex ATPase component TadA [Pseudomonadota bacterium]
MAATVPTIITIASGKGGVGKTNVSLNLALALVDEKRKVILLDADLGLANVDVLLGLATQYSLIDFVEGRCTWEEVMVTGPRSLGIIPGGNALDRLPQLSKSERRRLLEAVGHLKHFDAVIVDTSAGISELVLNFLQAAGIPILVMTPEPTSLTDAYSLLKVFQKRKPQAPVYVLANRVKTVDQAKKLFKRFGAAAANYLQTTVKPFGYIVEDPNVTTAVIRQVPFIYLYPNSPASRSLRRMAAQLSTLIGAPGKTGNLEALFDFSSPAAAAAPIRPETPPAAPPPPAREPEPAADGFDLEKSGDIVRLLIKEGHLSTSQAAYAHKVQTKLDTPQLFLDTLKDLGFVNEEQIRSTLLNNRTGIRLGSLLVELGHIDEKQLSAALNRQREIQGQKRLGEVLVENKYISEYDLTQVLSMHLGFPYVEPRSEMLDPKLMEKSQRDQLLLHRFLPVQRENDSIRVAMSDPLNATAMAAVKKMYGPNIIPLITMDRFIHDTLESYEYLKDSAKRQETSQTEIVEIVDQIILEALKKGASDIHVEPMKNRLRIRFRKDGSLVNHADLSKDLEPAIINRLKVMATANLAEKRRHQDGRILMDTKQTGEEVDLRVSFYVTLFGEKVVMRILTKKVELFKIEDVGMGSKMLDRFRDDALDSPTGVVIITGPTGAGKTTTLY